MIRATNLTKFYGDRRALGPISFEIEDGETVGFLGLNGAGKTTALRILACDLRPSAGSIQIGGADVVADPHEVRKRIGFLPENPPLYVDMPVDDYLLFAGELRGMDRAAVRRRIPEVLEVTDLTSVAAEPIGTLSHGYRQRVGVAQAIIHKPKFLIFDEPTRGLDPVQIVEMRNLIHDLKQNHTVLISSHILTEISQTCDRLLVLGQGQLLGSGTEAELSMRESKIMQITVTVRQPPPARLDEGGSVGRGSTSAGSAGLIEGTDAAGLVAKVLASVEGVTNVSAPYAAGDTLTFSLVTASDCRADVTRGIVEAKLDLLKLDYARSELENTFIRIVGGPHGSN